MSSSVVQIHPDDDVAVAPEGLPAGSPGPNSIVARETIPPGHKVALRSIRAGDPVRKFGWPLGLATQDIAAGEHVHSHNLATALSDEDSYSFSPAAKDQDQAQVAPRHFMGYRRADGRVGTRNEIWILCTVGCVARTAQKIAAAANELWKDRVDGIHAFTHPFGCSQLGDDLSTTRAILARLAVHPNAGGVLILGLGCESNQLDSLLGTITVPDPRRLKAFTAQNEEDEIAHGLQAIGELIDLAELDRREACSLSDLVIGLKCGGSDGLSGITANALVGRMADRVTEAGGTAILTEIPEIFGAEHLLMARAETAEVFEAIGDLVNGFKRHFLDHNQPVSENPSPGNIVGGITTLEEKSLGAVQKAGGGRVSQVVSYGQQASRRGVVLLEAPGNDAVSSTALTAAGATVILFTTGRGTPLGFPAPTLKIASNSQLASRKPGWIDFDAGPIARGRSVDELASELLDLVIATADGGATRSETNDEREIAIWKRGVTL